MSCVSPVSPSPACSYGLAAAAATAGTASVAARLCGASLSAASMTVAAEGCARVGSGAEALEAAFGDATMRNDLWGSTLVEAAAGSAEVACSDAVIGACGTESPVGLRVGFKVETLEAPVCASAVSAVRVAFTLTDA
eukprot:5337598-Pleurochrysis_carterae.AAC.1